jgi:hypothetical protein
MEDIEDLFNEDFKEDTSPLVIPEFGNCGAEDGQEESKGVPSKASCCQTGGK